MRIAIAGTGDLARYFYTSLPHHGHTPVALTRSHKPFLTDLSIEQRITDYYNIPSLTSHLIDCDAIISTISTTGPTHVFAHLALLEACKLSPRCKRFIPSEWTGNIETHPHLEPRYMHSTREPIRQALRAQNEIEWTLVLVGWFAEYLLPVGHGGRFFGELSVGWPVDFAGRVFVLYGEGERGVTVTSARDAVAAVVGLLEGERAWEEYTHLVGETVSWRGLLEALRGRGGEWMVVERGHEEAMRRVEEAERGGEHGEKVEAQLQMLGFTEYNCLDLEKARRQRDGYFHGVPFRGVGQILDEAEAKRME
ncbi:hypothetical protein BJX64DRAFT_284858 [Aspergillus heterothallicus]